MFLELISEKYLIISTKSSGNNILYTYILFIFLFILKLAII